jgi:leader peptidase (prepilin peptidase)/N-methyltransferase
MTGTGVVVPDAFNMQIQELSAMTMYGFGLLLFYILTICLVVYFFTEFYIDTYQISMTERWVMIGIGFLFGILDLWFGSSMIYFPIWGLLGYLLVVDAKYQELPDGVNLTIAVMALPIVIKSFQEPTFWSWTVLSGIALFLFFLVLLMLGGMGGGDVKMMGAIGLYFPLFDVPQLLFFGFAVGVLHALTFLFKKDVTLKTKFAFGPGLIIGVLLTSLL